VVPAQTGFGPEMVGTGTGFTVTFKFPEAEFAVVFIYDTLTVFAPEVVHKTVIAAVPDPPVIVPPDETFQLYPVIPDCVEYELLEFTHTLVDPVMVASSVTTIVLLLVLVPFAL